MRFAIFFVVLMFYFSPNGGLLSGGALAAEPGWLKAKSPLNEQNVWLNSKEPIRFDWSGEADKDTVLEVARDSDFRVLIVEEFYPASPHFTDKLKEEGTYYWRLSQKAEGGRKAHFNAIRFIVVNPVGPGLIFPFSDFKSPPAKPLKFYWQEKKGIAQFRFQLATDSAFNNLHTDRLISGTQTDAQKLSEGTYYWRVRAEENPAATSAWSEGRSFQVTKAPAEPAKPKAVKIPPPRKKAPLGPLPSVAGPVKLTRPHVKGSAQNVVLKFKGGKNNAPSAETILNPPVLRWSETPGATAYELQISRRSDFSQLEWVATVAGTEAEWAEAAPGKYYWRVRALNGENITGPFSAAGNLDLKLPVPVLKNHSPYKLKLKPAADGSMFSELSLAWTPVPGASGYQVLVAENMRFAPVKHDLKSEKPAMEIELKEGGTLYVKVAALGPGGESGGSFSKVAVLKVEVESELPAPVLKLPPDGSAIVSFNGQQAPLSFKWDEVGAAENYRIEISMTPDFKKPIYSEVVEFPQTVLNKKFPKVRLYWRVRAEQGKAKSSWSEVYSFEHAK